MTKQNEPVAWLHEVTQDNGELDQALSFFPDSFPLQNVGGFRSVSCTPLYTRPSTAPMSEEEILQMWTYRNPFTNGEFDSFETQLIKFARGIEARSKA